MDSINGNHAGGNSTAASGLSAQSSILKPRMRPADIRFVSLKMFGKEDIESLGPRVSGSNVELLSEANTLAVLMFDFHRWILSYFFATYRILLSTQEILDELVVIISAYLWGFVALLYQEDIDSYSCSADTKSTGATNSSGLQTAYKFASQVINFPTRLGNHALRKSLQIGVPRNRKTVRTAAGKGPFPETIGIIFEMFPLVLPPPPEVPLPYLNADKKIEVPDKKEVSKVLRERAEWLAAQHTHKASEIMRVCNEAARVIAWSACLGTRNITLQEFNGYAWKNVDMLVSLVKAELNNLDRGVEKRRILPDVIRFVNVRSKEVRTLGDYDYEQENGDRLTPLQPSPLSSSSVFAERDGPTSSGIPELLDLHANLTVFLTSGYDELDFDKIIDIIDEKVESGTSEITSEDLIKIEKIGHRAEKSTPSPEILIKYTSVRQPKYSLNGFPLRPCKTNLNPFICMTKPASFPAFVRAIEAYSKHSTRLDG
ncbi:DEKNAAC101097 [Brettanomyces naardenensis]|uniref:DEKNAAC101097 n=1 Tax=Brettanomyces naardenensis TaxID=13370 RepID=A0A448YHB4_BRENA|nr:DEKNAAC101097 [Brettanomyces naardenensis]